jgi:hypothetical protein
MRALLSLVLHLLTQMKTMSMREQVSSACAGDTHTGAERGREQVSICTISWILSLVLHLPTQDQSVKRAGGHVCHFTPMGFTRIGKAQVSNMTGPVQVPTSSRGKGMPVRQCSVHYIRLLGGMGCQSATPFVVPTLRWTRIMSWACKAACRGSTCRPTHILSFFLRFCS